MTDTKICTYCGREGHRASQCPWRRQPVSYDVLTHIAGSTVVVMRSSERYIDAKQDVRTPDFTKLECVSRGHACHYESVPNYRAPERIVELMRSWL